MSERRLFSADSHCVITTDQVKQNLASKYHDAWDAGMTKFDQKRDELQAGEQLELEDFVDLEAARHPGYFDSKARLAAMDADAKMRQAATEQLPAFHKQYFSDWIKKLVQKRETACAAATAGPPTVLL